MYQVAIQFGHASFWNAAEKNKQPAFFYHVYDLCLCGVSRSCGYNFVSALSIRQTVYLLNGAVLGTAMN
jgi:hypothetical protein